MKLKKIFSSITKKLSDSNAIKKDQIHGVDIKAKGISPKISHHNVKISHCKKVILKLDDNKETQRKRNRREENSSTCKKCNGSNTGIYILGALVLVLLIIIASKWK